MMDKTSKKPRHLRNDVLLIAALLLLATLGAVYLFALRPAGDYVQVTVDGKLYGCYRLSQDRVEDIYTGDQHNRLVIRDGKAYVETATCPDGICADHRPIFRSGESIVCLPHRVVITVVGKDAQGVDAVA